MHIGALRFNLANRRLLLLLNYKFAKLVSQGLNARLINFVHLFLAEVFAVLSRFAVLSLLLLCRFTTSFKISKVASTNTVLLSHVCCY